MDIGIGLGIGVCLGAGVGNRMMSCDEQPCTYVRFLPRAENLSMFASTKTVVLWFLSSDVCWDGPSQQRLYCVILYYYCMREMQTCESVCTVQHSTAQHPHSTRMHSICLPIAVQ